MIGLFVLYARREGAVVEKHGTPKNKELKLLSGMPWSPTIPINLPNFKAFKPSFIRDLGCIILPPNLCRTDKI